MAGPVLACGLTTMTTELPIRIVPVDFDDPHIQALLRLHLHHMHDQSPPGTSYALDLSGLRTPEIHFVAAWEGDALLGFGALKALGPTAGEIKSMRTAPAHLRRGVARRLLLHLLDVARSRGYTRVSLETGSGPAFEAALALYQRHGFVAGEPFGDYRPSAFNQFFHLAL